MSLNQCIIIMLPSAIVVAFIILSVSNKKKCNYIKKLESIAYIDELTKLPNRKALNTQLQLKGVHYFFMLDLAHFKFFNEIETNKKGDEFLQLLSKQLLVFTQNKKIEAFRFYGDIFILAIKENYTEKEILNLADNLSSLVCNDLHIEDCTVSVCCNIGIFAYEYKEEHTKSNECRLKTIDTITNTLHFAVDTAKKTKAYNVHLINKFEYKKHFENQILESKITKEITKEAIIPFYQPKVDTRTGEIIGVETLARWNHPTTNRLYPDEFIPILESKREIDLVDYLVLEKACANLKSWIDGELVSENFSLSFNFSIITIEKNDICSWFTCLHEKYNLPYSRLEMEITETIFADNISCISEKVAKISNLGVKISLDDYTTGSATIQQFTKLTLDNIKIDKSILSTGMNQRSQYIFENLLDLCHRFNITMIVEGVETKEQIEFLQQIGIFNVQGFFFSPALSYENFTNMLENKKGV